MQTPDGSQIRLSDTISFNELESQFDYDPDFRRQERKIAETNTKFSAEVQRQKFVAKAQSGVRRVIKAAPRSYQ